MKWVVMRHGQTGWNVARRIQGIQDVPILPSSVSQLEQKCRQLQKEYPFPFSLIVTSPLLRARQSAEVCNRFFQVPCRMDASFQERSFGCLEGKTVEELKAEYGIDDIEQWHSDEYAVEAWDAFLDRVERGMHLLERDCRNETVLLVTHGSVVKAIGALYGKDLGIIENGGFVTSEQLL